MENSRLRGSNFAYISFTHSKNCLLYSSHVLDPVKGTMNKTKTSKQKKSPFTLEWEYLIFYNNFRQEDRICVGNLAISGKVTEPWSILVLKNYHIG